MTLGRRTPGCGSETPRGVHSRRAPREAAETLYQSRSSQKSDLDRPQRNLFSMPQLGRQCEIGW
jgi:hypothetical protein